MKHHHLKIHNHQGFQDHSLAAFYPLLGVFAVVCILTTFGVLIFNQDFMLAFMGYFFIVFGSLKVMSITNFVKAYQLYDVLAMRSKTYAYAYPFLELWFGIAYLFAWQIQTVSLLVVIIMLTGASGVYLKLKQREEIPCACLGTVFKVPMTWVTLGEDMVMAAMALMLLV